MVFSFGLPFPGKKTLVIQPIHAPHDFINLYKVTPQPLMVWGKSSAYSASPDTSNPPTLATSLRFVTMLGDIISGATDEAMLFYSTWNLYCPVRY
eukprot:g28436.t1